MTDRRAGARATAEDVGGSVRGPAPPTVVPLKADVGSDGHNVSAFEIYQLGRQPASRLLRISHVNSDAPPEDHAVVRTTAGEQTIDTVTFTDRPGPIDAPLRHSQRRHEAIRRAFSQHYDSLCRLAYVMTGDAAAAEEIVMDVFTDTLRSWRPLPGSDDVISYLRRGVVNRSHSAGRRKGVERAANERVSRTSAAVVQAPDVGERDSITAAVRTLPKRQRAAIVLTYFLDLPLADTASILGCSVGTVKSQLSKARAHLATTLEGQS